MVRGVPQDDAQAVAWYRKAADQGDARAQTNLGAAYETGRGVARDLAQALNGIARLPINSTRQPSTFSAKCTQPAGACRRTTGRLPKWFRKAADHGYATAQFNLAYLYGEGRGVPQDRGQALAWYRKAADQGHTGAQTNLGAAYEAGHGVEQDFAQAADWYRKAADHGNAVAQYNLGKLYGSGRGVPQDYRQASGVVPQGRRTGPRPSRRPASVTPTTLAAACRRIRRKRPTGIARLPMTEASMLMYALGLLYQQGRGVPQDVVQADRWIVLAIQRVCGLREGANVRERSRRARTSRAR